MFSRLLEVGAHRIADALQIGHIYSARQLSQPIYEEAPIGRRIFKLQRVET